MIPNQQVHQLVLYKKLSVGSKNDAALKITKVQTLQTVRPVVSGVVVQALAVVDIALSLSGATCMWQRYIISIM